MENAPWLPSGLEEGCFVIGIALIFGAFYFSVLVSSRAGVSLKFEREALAREIAKRRESEAALQGAYAEIEQRVQERTSSLHEANRKLMKEIHGRKDFERALRESRTQYQMLAEASRDVIYTIDAEDTVVYVNSFAGEQLGKEPKHLIGRKRSELFSAEISVGQRRSLDLVFSTGKPLRVENPARFRDHDGWQDTHLIPIKNDDGHVVAVMGISRDITERKRAEESLRKREEESFRFMERLRSLHEVSAELARVAEQGAFDDLCRRAIELGVTDLGFERLGLWFRDPITNDACGSFGIDENGCIRDERSHRFDIGPNSLIGKPLSERKHSWIEEDAPIFNLQGEVIGHGSVAYAILWDGPEIYGFLSTDTFLSGRPITERSWEILTLFASMLGNLCKIKRAEQSLRESEERYRGLIEGLSEAVYRMSLPDGKYEYAGEATELVFGYAKENFLEKSGFVREIVHSDSEAYLHEMWESLLRGEMPSTYEYKIIDPYGKERWILQSNTLIRNDIGEPVAIEGICRNVTDQRQARQLLEEQRAKFLNSAKMSVLGEMASNVAHEINNPLAIVSGSAEQLMTIIARGDALHEHVPRLAETIIRNVARIQSIIKGLRAFTRKGENDPFQLVAMKTVLEETVVLSRDLFLSHHISLTMSEVSAELFIECRPTQIMEVLFNLLSNAMHAVETCEEKWVNIEVVDEGEGVAIFVTDSGPGVPPEIAKFLFDRFVTSKEFDKGTGLGLSISKRIVSTHDGSLVLDENFPHTRFVVRLPKRQSESQG
jgi:PAS domain S-box-containing protein